MTKEDTAKILAIIQEVYPHFMDGRDSDRTTDIWLSIFSTEPYAIVEAATLAFICKNTRGFPPNIGEIKEQIAQMQTACALDESAAWAAVMNALENSLYDACAEFEKLPLDVQHAVGNAGQLQRWARMDVEILSSVVASNFMRSFRAKATCAREFAKLPEKAKQLFITAGDAFSMRTAIGDGTEDMMP